MPWSKEDFSDINQDLLSQRDYLGSEKFVQTFLQITRFVCDAKYFDRLLIYRLVVAVIGFLISCFRFLKIVDVAYASYSRW